MKLNKDSYKDYKNYTERIIQFGEGNFLRAFVDWMVDKMNKEADFNASVVVVQPIEKGLVEMLNEQQGLYTLYLQGMKDGKAIREHEVINSISRGINPYKEFDEYMQVATNPELRYVISNTTEAGISFNENDKLEDAPQKSFPGKLTAFLYKRYKAFNGNKDKGLIIIPCELIDRNGEKLKEAILKYAKLWTLEEEFITWVEDVNTFCCTLVDRIVTGYPRANIDEITQELGYEDNLVDVGEQFHLWVIEGPEWIKDEIPFDKCNLNVKVVKDMTPYRERKVRILNGSHTSMVPVSYLYGIDTVRETVEHEVIGKFVEEVIFQEIIPTLNLPKDELKEFAEEVLDRFRNPYVKHNLIDISLNSMSKFKTRDLPSLLEYHNRFKDLPEKLTFSIAATIAFYRGVRGEEKINLRDDSDILELYASLWKNFDGSMEAVTEIVEKVLSYQKNWGCDLNNVEGLTDKVSKYLYNIVTIGMKESVNNIMIEG